MIKEIALDVDGVFADFDLSVKKLTGLDAQQMHTDKSIRNKVWRAINSQPYEFWSNLQMIQEAQILFALASQRKHYFLTGLPGDSVGLGKKGKEDWLLARFNVSIEQIKVVKRKDKALFAHKHALLIDDNKENCEMWQEAGGIAICHKTVAKTYQELQQLLGV